MGGAGLRHGNAGPAGGERRAPGELEAEILAIVRAAGTPLSPGEVRQRLAPRSPAARSGPGGRAKPGMPGEGPSAGADQGELSYSTVVTIMSRLHAKGLLARQRAGRGFTYTPVDKASVAARLMGQVLGREQDHDAVLTRFVSGLSARDARLLRELLEDEPGPRGRDRAGEPE